jgi:hypothetical protein
LCLEDGSVSARRGLEMLFNHERVALEHTNNVLLAKRAIHLIPLNCIHLGQFH